MIIQEKKKFFKKYFKVQEWTPKSKPVLNVKNLKKNYKKNILELTGGGVKGVLTAYNLYSIEYHTKGKIFNIFNTFYGTSTGAVIAAGINFGISTKELLKFYIEAPTNIFKKRFLWGAFTKSIYKTDYLEETLKKYFKDTTFIELYRKTKKTLIICSINVLKDENIFCNYKSTPNMRVRDAVMGSISIPIVFPPKYTHTNYAKKEGEVLLYDGGIATYSSMAIKAFNQAFWVDKYKTKDFFIASFGTGYVKENHTIKEIIKGNKLKKGVWAIMYLLGETVKKQERNLEYRKQDHGLNYFRWDKKLPKDLNDSLCTDNVKKLVEIVDK